MSQGSREVAGSGRSRRRSRSSPAGERRDGEAAVDAPAAQPAMTVLPGRKAFAEPAAAPVAERARTNLLSLARARILVWATPRGERAEFEVSKAVSVALQAKCKTAPLCAGESAENPGWLDPQAAPLGTCPYAYESRGECICDRNAEALGAALFGPGEARLVRNYLHALGYGVREEEVPPLDLGGMRILHAHSKIGDSHDVRVMGVPGVGELVLVRDLSTNGPGQTGARETK